MGRMESKSTIGVKYYDVLSKKTFGDIVKTQEQMFAAKGGLSKEDAQKLFASSRGGYANTDKLEETLDEILHCLKANAGI